MTEPKLGVQLYTLREQCKTAEDFEETLKMLDGIGCNIIQISGIGDFAPEIKAELVKKYNMDVCVTHIQFDRMLNDFDAVVYEHKLLNCKNIGIGSMPGPYQHSEEGVSEFIKLAGEVARKLKDNGFNFGYHNHAFEFEVHGGKRTMDRLIEETPADCFHFIPDTYWMQVGGVTPADYLKRLSGRVDVCHFKDMRIVEAQQRFAECGDGNMDMSACYRSCCEIDAGYIVIEQDNCYDVHPYDAVKKGYKGLLRVSELKK